MEGFNGEFAILDIELFNNIDKALEDNDYKYQAEVLIEVANRKMLDDFDIIRTTSIMASIICNLDEDISYADDGFPSEECNVMKMSDEIQDMLYDGLEKEKVMDFIKNELIFRERYELLNEINKNEKNS
jgi:hypothetical protein